MAMIYARFLARVRACVHLRRVLVRQCLAEFLGVFILIVITLSASAQSTTSEGRKGGYFSSALAGGVAVMVAIHIAGGVSGGHLNPAYSLAMCLVAECPWWKLPIFSTVQIAGAFFGAGTVYVLYHDAIHHYSNGTLKVTGPRETASIFATYPAPYLSLWNGFFDQVKAPALPPRKYDAVMTVPTFAHRNLDTFVGSLLPSLSPAKTDDLGNLL